jgi:hypothetical protein
MSQDEVEYLTRRAERQLELAQRATLPKVTAFHYQLASLYLERIAPHLPDGTAREPNLKPLVWR